MARKLAFDRLLFGSVVLLVLIGLLMIYSATAMQVLLPTPGAPAGGRRLAGNSHTGVRCSTYQVKDEWSTRTQHCNLLLRMDLRAS